MTALSVALVTRCVCGAWVATHREHPGGNRGYKLRSNGEWLNCWSQAQMRDWLQQDSDIRLIMQGLLFFRTVNCKACMDGGCTPEVELKAYRTVGDA